MAGIENLHPGGGGALATESIYVSSPLEWIDTGSTLSVALRSFSLMKVGSQWVIYGGLGGAGIVNSILTSPDLLNWSVSANNLGANLLQSATAIQTSSHVYLIGAYSGAGGLATVMRAPVATPTVMAAHTSLPAALGAGVVFIVDSTVFVVSGYDGAAAPSNVIYYISISDLDAGAPWSTAVPEVFVNAHGDGTLVAIGEHLVIAGGYSAGSATSAIYTAHVSAPKSWNLSAKVLPVADYGVQAIAARDSITWLGGYASTKLMVSSKQTPDLLTEIAPSSTPALLFGAGVAYKDGYVYLLGGRDGGGVLTNKIHRSKYRTSVAADAIPSVVQARRATLPDGQMAFQSPSERCGVAHWTHYAYAPRSV